MNSLVGTEELEFRSRLADRLEAGETFVEALYAMVPDEKSPHLQWVATQMCADFQAAKLLETFSRHPDVFDDQFIQALEGLMAVPQDNGDQFLQLLRGN